jgi:hypothetical protein
MFTYMLTLPNDQEWPGFQIIQRRPEFQGAIPIQSPGHEIYLFFSDETPAVLAKRMLEGVPRHPKVSLSLIGNPTFFPE